MSARNALILVCLQLFLNTEASYPQNAVWNRVSFPHGIRVDRIALNTGGDIFLCTWWHPSSMVLDGNIDRIERSTNHGSTWEIVFDAGWQPITLAIDPTDVVYAGKFEAVCRSSNNGATWDILSDTLFNGLFIQSISANPKGDLFIAPGTFRSTDLGRTWNRIPLQQQASDLLFLKNGTMFAGVYSGSYPAPSRSVYRSTDDGNSWDSVFTSDNSSGLELASSENGAVFAAAMGNDSVHGGVFRSTDNGTTWASVNEGLPSREINALVVSSTGVLFAASEGKGIFRSVDYGDSWTDFTNGLQDLRIQCLAISSDDRLFVGTGTDSLPTASTPAGGVYVCDATTPVNRNDGKLTSGFQLFQNYPNPFNPSTDISFQLPTELFVSLKVFDVLGREVATLVSEMLRPGRYTRRWNAISFPAGIYFCRMESAHRIQTKKLVLLK